MPVGWLRWPVCAYSGVPVAVRSVLQLIIVLAAGHAGHAVCACMSCVWATPSLLGCRTFVRACWQRGSLGQAGGYVVEGLTLPCAPSVMRRAARVSAQAGAHCPGQARLAERRVVSGRCGRVMRCCGVAVVCVVTCVACWCAAWRYWRACGAGGRCGNVPLAR